MNMAAIKAACNNNRLTCLAMMSGAVLMVLALFWAAQASALGGQDARLRKVENQLSGARATLNSMSKQLDRIEAQGGHGRAVIVTPQGD